MIDAGLSAENWKAKLHGLSGNKESIDDNQTDIN